MSKANRIEATKKIELVPLIDVIFLLLIFFLVTLNIIPILTRKEMRESQFPVEVITAEDAARVDMLIQLHQFPDDRFNRVFYFTIDGDLPWLGRPEMTGVLERIPEFARSISTLGALRTRFPGHFFERPEQIPYPKNGEVIISASEWVPYERLFEVIQGCDRRGVSKKHCVVGSFEELQDKIRPTPPEQIVEKYEH